MLSVAEDRVIGFDRQFLAEVRIEHLFEIVTIHLLHTLVRNDYLPSLSIAPLQT